MGRWSLHDNRLLLGAVACELALLVAFLALPPVAHVLGHAAPTALGWALAALVVPAVLLVDAAQKTVLARLARRDRNHGPSGNRTRRPCRSGAPRPRLSR